MITRVSNEFIITADGHVSRHQYDAMGRLLEEREYKGIDRADGRAELVRFT